MQPMTFWPMNDLARRVDRVLDVAEAAIALVETDHPSVDLEALEAPPDKVIAETAMFLRAAHAIPEERAPGVAARARGLLQALAPHARHPRVAIGLALHPALARDYGAAHAVLARAGLPDQGFDTLLAAAIAAPNATARERLPHRELEQHWLASLVDRAPVPQELIDRTAIGRGVDLLTGSRDDVYALTHALMYATDFGHNGPRGTQPSTLLASVRSALAGALDDDDFDVVGELLLAWPFLRAGWGRTESLVFAVLARVEDQVGLLPSLAIDQVGYHQQPAEARKQYVAATTYHTAYVMGLLCATMLHHDSRPARGPFSTGGDARFANDLFAQLASEARRPQWLGEVAELAEGQRGQYAGFLLDIALRRAVRRLDLATVQRLLARAVEHGVALSPLCGQAAGILGRMAHVASLIGASTHENALSANLVVA